MRDPEKYSWADKYREQPRPGIQWGMVGWLLMVLGFFVLAWLTR